MNPVPFEIPSPAELKTIREELGLSAAELAGELGFGPDGERIVRAWEFGKRNGKPCAPTALAWCAIRLMLVCRRTLDGAITDEQLGSALTLMKNRNRLVYLRNNVPESIL